MCVCVCFLTETDRNISGSSKMFGLDFAQILNIIISLFKCLFFCLSKTLSSNSFQRPPVLTPFNDPQFQCFSMTPNPFFSQIMYSLISMQKFAAFLFKKKEIHVNYFFIIHLRLIFWLSKALCHLPVKLRMLSLNKCIITLYSKKDTGLKFSYVKLLLIQRGALAINIGEWVCGFGCFLRM